MSNNSQPVSNKVVIVTKDDSGRKLFLDTNNTACKMRWVESFHFATQFKPVRAIQVIESMSQSTRALRTMWTEPVEGNRLYSAAQILTDSLCTAHDEFTYRCNICQLRSSVLYEIFQANLSRLSREKVSQLLKDISKSLE